MISRHTRLDPHVPHKRFARFESFELDLTAGELLKGGRHIRLQNQPFQILLLLLEQPGEIVTKEQIRERLWPGNTVVEFEHSIGTALKKLRQALGDDTGSPRYIAKLNRRGYRWLVPVECFDAGAATVPNATPNSAATLLAELAQPSASESAPPTRLFGRNRELDELDSCLEKMWSGQRQIVCVRGEPGIGKTALVDEFVRKAQSTFFGLRVARGQCVEGYGGKEAYYPVLEAVGVLARELGDEFVRVLAARAPTWLVQFPALLTREHWEALQREILGATRERMLREIDDALETVTSAIPLLLVIEDLQWADPSTVDLISVIARRRGPARIMLVGTMRSLEIEAAEHPLKALKDDLEAHQLCQVITLSSLVEAEIREYLVSGSPKSSTPPGLAALVLRHSGGNPLFMVAAVEHLQGRGLISREEGQWQLNKPIEKIELDVPQRMRRMIEAQIERLSGEQQRALEAASVNGMAFETNVTAAAAGVDVEAFEELCEDLSRRDHMVRWAGSRRLPDGTVSLGYEFTHAMYREVFYQRQAHGRKIKLHLRIGELLEAHYAGDSGQVPAARLAYQFEQASDSVRATKYLESASNEAGKRFEPRQAVEILRHALELAQNIPEPQRTQPEIEILQKLSWIYFSLLDPRSLETYDTLISRAADRNLLEVQFSALLEMAVPMAMFRGLADYEKAVGRAFNLLAEFTDADSLKQEVRRARCECFQAVSGKWLRGDLARWLELVNKLRESGERDLLAQLEFNMVYYVLRSSRYREAMQYADEGFAILLEGYERNAYLNFYNRLREHVMMEALLFGGDWGKALQVINRCDHMAEQNGDRIGMLLFSLIRAHGHVIMLNFPGARQAFDSALPETLNIALYENLIYAGLAEVGLGDSKAALQYFEKAKDHTAKSESMSDWYNRMPLQWGLTDAWLLEGDVEQATVEAAEFMKVALATDERTYWALAYETSARVSMAKGDLRQAEDFLANARESMQGFDVPLAHWRVHATGFELYRRLENPELAENHRQLSCATIMKLADSLPADEPLRATFLSALQVRRILNPNGVLQCPGDV